MSQARLSPEKARALTHSPGLYEASKRVRIHRICLFGFDENRGNTLLAASRTGKRYSVTSHTDAELAEICLPDGGHVREQDAISIILSTSAEAILYGYACFRNAKNASEKRGARQASLLIISDYTGMDVFRPILVDGLQLLLESPQWGDEMYWTNALTSLKFALERGFNRATSQQMRLIHAEAEETITLDLWQHTYKLRRVPLGVAEFGGACLKDLVRIFKEKTIRIWYALAAEKRVVFVGSQMNASSLSSLVLAAPTLLGELAEFAVPVLEPYLTLGVIDRIIGKRTFVCGTNNALFLSKPEWWDVCCDVSTGAVYEQDDTPQPQSESAHQPQQQQQSAPVTRASRVLIGLRRRVSSQTHHRAHSFPPSLGGIIAGHARTAGGVEMAYISRVLHDIDSHTETWLRRQFHDFTLSFLNRVARRGITFDLAQALAGLLPTPSLMQPRLARFADNFSHGALYKKYRAKQDSVWGGGNLNSSSLSASSFRGALPSPMSRSFSDPTPEDMSFLHLASLKSLAPFYIECATGEWRAPTGFIRVEEGSSSPKRTSANLSRTRGTSENDHQKHNSFRENQQHPSPKKPLATSSPDRWVRVKPKGAAEVYFWNVETGETSWEDPDIALL
jgi:hypothetical protein